ncbi:hypothetical protein [Edaphobacter aggregans]|uniref:hypothetical protein n=1 Tax=Edaphobacter aggregans TaxID=570835 RepID=UPI0012F94A85|nr:hypothetical protein [Edaphobacter aggregans]
MSLDSYVENAWLKKEAASPQEITDQLGIVARCMKDASVEGISDDLRFYTTFNALLALANTALRASGYRTTNQQGHHMRTIETLEYTIHADSKTIRKILAFSKKRNIASYDAAGSISNEELKQILVTAESLQDAVQTWLTATHPELLTP